MAISKLSSGSEKYSQRLGERLARASTSEFFFHRTCYLVGAFSVTSSRRLRFLYCQRARKRSRFLVDSLRRGSPLLLFFPFIDYVFGITVSRNRRSSVIFLPLFIKKVNSSLFRITFYLFLVQNVPNFSQYFTDKNETEISCSEKVHKCFIKNIITEQLWRARQVRSTSTMDQSLGPSDFKSSNVYSWKE